MTLDIQKTLERFSLLSGLPMEEAVAFTALCSEAAAELARKARSAVTEQNAPRLQAAAACLAYYRYAMYQATGEESFSVGDITVSGGTNDKVRFAKEIWLETRDGISDLLEDDGFLFRQVKA